jgi:hypothetical protein
MRNWQRLKCDGIGPPQLSEMGCGMMLHLSAHSANRRAPVASWQVRKRSLKEFIPPAGRTALERAGLRTRDPIGAPSLSASALRSHLVRHRCGKDVCGCNDICESVNGLNHRTGDPAQISPAETFDLSIDPSEAPSLGLETMKSENRNAKSESVSTINQLTRTHPKNACHPRMFLSGVQNALSACPPQAGWPPKTCLHADLFAETECRRKCGAPACRSTSVRRHVSARRRGKVDVFDRVSRRLLNKHAID